MKTAQFVAGVDARLSPGFEAQVQQLAARLEEAIALLRAERSTYVRRWIIEVERQLEAMGLKPQRRLW